jgi:hypothetical protein
MLRRWQDGGLLTFPESQNPTILKDLGALEDMHVVPQPVSSRALFEPTKREATNYMKKTLGRFVLSIHLLLEALLLGAPLPGPLHRKALLFCALLPCAPLLGTLHCAGRAVPHSHGGSTLYRLCPAQDCAPVAMEL